MSTSSLPAAIDAEKSVLGAILLNNDSFYQCHSLRPEDFSLDSHRRIYSRIVDLASGTRPIDLITLTEELGRHKELEAVGSASYVSGLLDGVPERPSIEEYVNIVRERSRRRRLIHTCNAAIAQAEDMSETLRDCISITHDRILDLAADGQEKSLRLSDYTQGVVDEIERMSRMDPSQTAIGLTTSIPKLDEFTTGMRPGELWIIGSWTGSGKSALLSQIIAANAIVGLRCLWFTQEMTRRQVLLRMVPQITDGRIRGRDLRDPRNMSIAQIRLFKETCAEIEKWPVWVQDSATIDIATLVAHSQMMIKRHGVGLVTVDYLQLLRSEGDSRAERVSRVSAGLRELAKSANIPVLVVSQLSRPEGKEKRPPRLFDLKESGDIENDAHVILFPHRPEGKDGKLTFEDIISIGKQREGPTGTIKVEFDTASLRFKPRETEGPDDPSMF